jgi:hypothetical protein
MSKVVANWKALLVCWFFGADLEIWRWQEYLYWIN